MFGLIRFSVYFIFSTLILSIPINEKPLFYSVQKYSGPITNMALKKVENLYNNLFSGNEPEELKNKIDQISSSLSSSVRQKFKPSPERKKRQEFFKTKELKPHHHYDMNDERQLEKILERR